MEHGLYALSRREVALSLVLEEVLVLNTGKEV